MKKLLLFFLFFLNLTFAQNNFSYLEVRLHDQTIGSPTFNNTINATTESNDAGLNLILQTHNVNSYIYKGGHVYPPFLDKFVELGCQNCNASQLLADLSSYSTVIDRARIINAQQTFDDALHMQIANTSIGIPTGNNNGVIVTNDIALNQIFQNFNVYYYTQTFPSSNNSNLLRYYDVVCNCNNQELKDALDAYSSVISFTEFLLPIYLLSNDQFQKNKTIVSPNPFSDNFTIQTEELISNYNLVDISGKQLLNTTSKEKIDNLSSQLNQGIYILNLTFENGQNANYKLVKQ